MELNLDYNDFVAIEEITKIRKQLEDDEKIDTVGNHLFWEYVVSNWQQWREYDITECENNKNWDYFDAINDFWTPFFIKKFGTAKDEDKYDYSVMQLCEIAFITSSLIADKQIQIELNDIDEWFGRVYKPILEEWSNGIKNHIFKDKKEEGYVGVYAKRRLRELYGVEEEEDVFSSERLCVIATTKERLLARNMIVLDTDDEDILIHTVYIPILKDYYKLGKGMAGYGTYAYKVLLQRYGINWRDKS